MSRDTSIEAYYGILDTLGERQARVYRVFLDHRQNEFTNQELLEEMKSHYGYGGDISDISPRVSELTKKGFIVETGKRECAVTKNTAITRKISIISEEIYQLDKIIPKPEWVLLNEDLIKKGYRYCGDGLWKRPKMG